MYGLRIMRSYVHARARNSEEGECEDRGRNHSLKGSDLFVDEAQDSAARYSQRGLGLVTLDTALLSKCSISEPRVELFKLANHVSSTCSCDAGSKAGRADKVHGGQGARVETCCGT
jgi:hypothetical protein